MKILPITVLGMLLFAPPVQAEVETEPGRLPPEANKQAPVQLLDYEFDIKALEQKPAPGEIPANVVLPPEIVSDDQWRGSQSGVTRAARWVIRRPEDWAQLWNDGLKPYSPRFEKVPAIDFEKDMVVAVFAGQSPSPGTTVAVRPIRPPQDGAQGLVINYRISTKMQPVFAPPFAVQPFHMRRVPRFVGPITFQEQPR
jgi:hypothetical protein